MAKRPDSSAGPSQRQQRVAELVRHALAEVLQRGEVQDPVLASHIVTIPQVRMSPDLKLGTAYVTVLGQDDTAPFVEALNRSAKFIRGRLTPALRGMKYMPEVRFRTDTSFDNFARIDALLRSPEVARDLDDEGEKE